MGIRITTNRVHITTEITQNDVKELDKIENLKYIQIGNYINNESLELIDEYITDRNQDIQFRIFGFDKTICKFRLNGLPISLETDCRFRSIGLSVLLQRSVN